MQTVIIAILTGFVPPLMWLYIWLREDRKRPEPSGLLTVCFILGMVGVAVALPLQKIVQASNIPEDGKIIFWAIIEEGVKFLPVYFLAIRSRFNDEAIDPAIYLITAALGFAALENLAYALGPHQASFTVSMLNGGLRFFGASLLHVVASGCIGIFLGLAPRGTNWFFGLFGFIGATFLHSTFNFFIMKDTTRTFFQVYGYLWVVTIITMLVLEKLRRIPPRTTPREVPL